MSAVIQRLSDRSGLGGKPFCEIGYSFEAEAVVCQRDHFLVSQGGNPLHHFRLQSPDPMLQNSSQKFQSGLLPAPLDDDIFRLNKFSVGYLRDIVRNKGIDVGLGGMFTANFNPPALTSVYGGTSHGGFSIFLRLRPSKHK